MNGKTKCKILKDIRRQIAENNDIEYITSECKFQGNCTGTCPKCEAELRYLEDALTKRQKAGKAIAVAGIAAAFMMSAAACAPDGPDTPAQLEGDIAYTVQTEPTENTLMGAPVPETEPLENTLMGMVPTYVPVLGDVPFPSGD